LDTLLCPFHYYAVDFSQFNQQVKKPRVQAYILRYYNASYL
jgi:hypothetical protein